MIVGEAVESQARLLQMADALYSQGPGSRLAKGRQKQRGQNPDDRNHTEQFDHAERAAELEPAQIATSSKGISVWSARSLLPLSTAPPSPDSARTFDRTGVSGSGSKLRALQTLRDGWPPCRA